MKVVKLVFGLLMVLAIVSGSVVVAQESDPPPMRSEPPEGEVPSPDTSYVERSMYAPSPPLEGDLAQREADKQRDLESLGLFAELEMMDTVAAPVLAPEDLLGPDLDLESEPALLEDKNPEIPAEKEDISVDVEENDTRAVGNETSLISISTLVGIDEYWSSVAHGGNYYMVVYPRSGNIYAKVYDNNGIWHYTHTVADLLNNCGYPSVAYEAKSGLFLVAYEHYFNTTDTDVLVQAVSATTGNVGGLASAGFTTFNEWYPNVACNPISGTCLVAYEHRQTNQIKGRFFTLSSTGITSSSAIYDLTGTMDSYRPYLAWGKGTGYYMLVYTRWNGIKYIALYNKLYQAPVPSGNQYLYTYAYVDLSNVSGGNHKKSTGVAYDPCTQKFVVAFQHDFLNNDTDWDVWAVAKVATADATGTSPFKVAFTAHNESNGAVSFVTDSHLTPACGGMDKLVVAYSNQTRGILAADLRGNNSKTTPAYVRDLESRHLVVMANTPSIIFTSINPVRIASGSAWARMFITGHPYYIGQDYDVWGRMVEVRARSFLPLVVR